MNDYFATLKIQQGRLKAAMAQLGIASAMELARASAVPSRTVYALLNFRLSPKSLAGWRPAVLAICKTLGAEPDDIFPEHLHHELPTNRIGSFVERDQLSGLGAPQLSPAEECIHSEVSDTMISLLDTLAPDEKVVIQSRFYRNLSLEATGAIIGHSRERVRQIQAKALRKLRHPSRLSVLEDVSNFN